MRLFDARSGTEITLPLTTPVRIVYPDREEITVLEVKTGRFSARALIAFKYWDHGRLVSTREWSPLTVRWMHPKYPLQAVAFIPT